MLITLTKLVFPLLIQITGLAQEFSLFHIQRIGIFFQERYATKNHGAIGLPRFPRAINSLMVHSIQKF